MASLETAVTKLTGVTPTTVSPAGLAGNQVDVLGVWTVANTYSQPISVYASIQRSGVDYMICNGGSLGVGNTLFIAGLLGKFALKVGDVLRVWLAASQTADVVVSVAREP